MGLWTPLTGSGGGGGDMLKSVYDSEDRAGQVLTENGDEQKIENATNSTSALSINNSAGDSIFRIDSANKRVYIDGPALYGSTTLFASLTSSAQSYQLNSQQVIAALNTRADGTLRSGITIHGRKDQGDNTTGDLYFEGSKGNATNNNGGDIYLDGGVPYGAGVPGRVVIGEDQSGGMILHGISVINGLANFPALTSLADNAEVLLATGTKGSGRVDVADNEEWANFSWKADGTVYLESNSENVSSTADDDGNLVIYDAGSGIGIKNMLGSTKEV